MCNISAHFNILVLNQILHLTLQRQQRVDRSSQSCQGYLCQTQLIVHALYS